MTRAGYFYSLSVCLLIGLGTCIGALWWQVLLVPAILSNAITLVILKHADDEWWTLERKLERREDVLQAYSNDYERIPNLENLIRRQHEQAEYIQAELMAWGQGLQELAQKCTDTNGEEENEEESNCKP